ncbi:MAG: class I tRNA ligase family protein, partial [Candidatus Methanomethylophilaceae archaeon]|nr:class I tRNA ligase family protein [Candidatus Methanomethylophilaceae archaeon]
DEKLHKKLFPMSMRPQSHDIIRTWAFYSILRAEQIEESIPWKDIMIHGFIMAPDGTPMHSSIGNVIDPIPILKNYGADALRYYAATCSLGIDHAFREKDVIRGRKLCNKVFNLGQFVRRFLDGVPESMPELRTSDRWIISKFSKVLESVTDSLYQYQFDKAMREVEGFIWHEFADNYVEMVKARNDPAVKYTLYNVFLGCIKMLAPFMPHVTEDVYQEHFKAIDGCRSVHLTSWPKPIFTDDDAEASGEVLKSVLAEIRAWKGERKIPLNAELSMIEFVGPEARALECAKDDIRETTKAKAVEIAPEATLTEDVVGIKPVHSKLGPAFKAQAKAIVSAAAAMDPAKAAEELSKGPLAFVIDGERVEVGPEYFEVEKRLLLDGKAVDTIQVGGILILIEI